MGKQIQFTKKDAYHTPGKAKRERIKVTTIQKAHLLKKFSNVLRDNKDGISFWFNTERFMTTARRYNFVASSILRDIELSEYIEEDESVSLKTIRRLLNYCQYPEEEELMLEFRRSNILARRYTGMKMPSWRSLTRKVCAAWQSNIWQCKSHKFQSAEVRTKV